RRGYSRAALKNCGLSNSRETPLSAYIQYNDDKTGRICNHYTTPGGRCQAGRSEGELHPAPAGAVGGHPDPCLVQHEAGGHAGVAVVVFVVVIDDLPDARLDDGFGTLVAGEEGDVDPRPLEVVVGAVEDGVQLGVAYVHIFGVQGLALPAPGHGVVVAADGHPVVAQREDLVFGADDAGPHLAVGVLGAHGGKQRDAHKVFVPVDVVVALFHKKRLPAQLDLWVLYRISVQNTMRGASLDKMHKS